MKGMILPLQNGGLILTEQNPGYEKSIRVFNGPEWDWFDEHSRVKIFRDSFGVSNQSNRMAYRLSGPSFILSRKRELISTAVCSGIIQVTHEGSLVMLMADAQTTGGYPGWQWWLQLTCPPVLNFAREIVFNSGKFRWTRQKNYI